MPNLQLSFDAELAYLSELEILASVMLAHATSLKTARSKWINAHGMLEVRFGLSPVSTGTATLVAERLRQQWKLWLPLECFLTAWGRASLLLYPARAKYSGRGAYLRGVLALDKDHLLSDRGPRDHWMHFDERLDSALARGGTIDAQRFDRILSPGGMAVRRVIMEPFSVGFLDTSPRLLEPMFMAASQLKERVLSAAGDIAHRNPPEGST